MNDFLNYDDSDIINEIKEQNPAVSNQFYYVSNYGHFPVYRCEGVKYYPTPNQAFKDQIEAVKKAKRFVFLEYLAIQDSIIFSQIFELLKACVLRGVEVRIIYDYLGSITFFNKDFIGKMKKHGIECRAFHSLGTNLFRFIMNRDHHKIMIVDNEIAFIGGYNIADEYFGIKEPYGKWQDTGLSFRHMAVKSMTANFLYMWNMIEKTDLDVSKYFAHNVHICKDTAGFIQPYCGNPYVNEPLAENVYLNVLKASTQYAYIITPYLIPDKVMIKELTLAAKRGVDVRIIIPGVPDKKWLYKASCSYLHGLSQENVKIYIYTPGFCHAKQFLCDGKVAVIGSINIDGRAFKRDFENAVLLYKVEAIKDMYEDFMRLFQESEDVTMKYKNKAPSFIIKLLTKIFASFI